MRGRTREAGSAWRVDSLGERCCGPPSMQETGCAGDSLGRCRRRLGCLHWGRCAERGAHGRRGTPWRVRRSGWRVRWRGVACRKGSRAVRGRARWRAQAPSVEADAQPGGRRTGGP